MHSIEPHHVSENWLIRSYMKPAFTVRVLLSSYQLVVSSHFFNLYREGKSDAVQGLERLTGIWTERKVYDSTLLEKLKKSMSESHTASLKLVLKILHTLPPFPPLHTHTDTHYWYRKIFVYIFASLAYVLLFLLELQNRLF